VCQTYFTEDHEWIRVEGDTATVGITNYAQEQLGDLVFVELPEIGRSVAKGDEAVVVESVKAASDVYAPVSGEITEVNEALTGDTLETQFVRLESGGGDADVEGRLAALKQQMGLLSGGEAEKPKQLGAGEEGEGGSPTEARSADDAVEADVEAVEEDGETSPGNEGVAEAELLEQFKDLEKNAEA